ncbi:hypothetical protein IMCC20628_01034 [Hoeflea sp. IMCC20628]|uniref:4Fe-4S dicluster domain-containing protein n=1 Tax=Hoeflea sp. IMCC20628 TaxID=1620421 RepID=UPI00063AE6A7|nr:4Fe-4S dicluster domain-containing protein [Hoeflea sp. IMCC20628]AKH99751.1 hypothetical protein IMCC20628_01034 [Hoeflea sp. IMCC20628]
MNEPRLIAVALELSGLVPRGWLAPEPEIAPLLADGRPAAGICLIGHAGGGFWPVFDTWWQSHPNSDDPLDDWSKHLINPVAASLGAEAVYPSDKPWQPFQQWAMAAEGLRPSPLGLLIHPGFGLWHGYRGAILFGSTDRVEATEARSIILSHPCDACAAKPCLSACPVSAFGAGGFDVNVCRGHLATDAGQKGCVDSGCMARDACPVGQDYRYQAAQVRFHMAAFL